MRIRNKKWAPKFIEDNKTIFFKEASITNEELINKVKKYNKIEFEVGCGKGQFIIQKAIANPDTLFLAIEKFASVIVKAGEKVIEQKIDNVMFYCGDIIDFNDSEGFFGKVDTVYLNFSDPWPKTRHAKRRLSADSFLEIYSKLLKDSGHLEMKTDNDNLFDFSVVTIANNINFNLEEVYVNLHETDKENFKTEYELKFSQLGYTIKYLKAKKNNIML